MLGRGTLLLVLCAATLTIGGCASPIGGASVVNKQNQFSISWELKDHTESKNYAWANNKAYARISFSTTLTGGTLTLVMTDQANTALCTIDFGTASVTSGVAVTKAAGQPGNWKIKFELRKFTGTLGASIEASDAAQGGETITCL